MYVEALFAYVYILPCLNTSYTTESEHAINYIYSSISFYKYGFNFFFFHTEKQKHRRTDWYKII